MSKSYKEHSKENWAPSTGDLSFPGHEVMQTGCLQRIASAMELLSKKYSDMERDLANYKDLYKRESERSEQYRKSAIAYKAHLTRANNKKL